MWFKCPLCKVMLKRDLRKTITREFMTKSGIYKSYCNWAGKIAYCKPETKGASK